MPNPKPPIDPSYCRRDASTFAVSSCSGYLWRRRCAKSRRGPPGRRSPRRESRCIRQSLARPSRSCRPGCCRRLATSMRCLRQRRNGSTPSAEARAGSRLAICDEIVSAVLEPTPYFRFFCERTGPGGDSTTPRQNLRWRLGRAFEDLDVHAEGSPSAVPQARQPQSITRTAPGGCHVGDAAQSAAATDSIGPKIPTFLAEFGCNSRTLKFAHSTASNPHVAEPAIHCVGSAHGLAGLHSPSSRNHGCSPHASTPAGTPSPAHEGPRTT